MRVSAPRKRESHGFLSTDYNLIPHHRVVTSVDESKVVGPLRVREHDELTDRIGDVPERQDTHHGAQMKQRPCPPREHAIARRIVNEAGREWAISRPRVRAVEWPFFKANTRRRPRRMIAAREDVFMALLFAAVAFVIGLGSLLFASQATIGVAGLCFACLIAVLARMGQSEDQHRRLIEKLTPPVAPRQKEPPSSAKASQVEITPGNIDQVAKRFGVTERT